MLLIMFVLTVISDIKYYSAIDPLPKDDNEQ